MTMKRSFEELREEYSRMSLAEGDLAPNPMDQFKRWYDDAVAQDIPLANAVTLATVSAEGQPSARVVLLKDIDHGLVFYTNYQSQKGQELAANSRASLLFWWPPLERQVRILGHCEKVADAMSDAYFATRPRMSNLSALASDQSRAVPSRDAMERRVEELAAEHPDAVPRPATWGGYRLLPSRFEFWQGRRDRLHDRLVYEPAGEGPDWAISRLYP